MIDPETRDIVQNEYLRRIDKVNGQLQNTEIETIPMVKDPWKEINHSSDVQPQQQCCPILPLPLREWARWMGAPPIWLPPPRAQHPQ